jgi:hypothetical protein
VPRFFAFFLRRCGSKRSVTPSKQFRVGKDTVVFGLTRRTISCLLVVVGLTKNVSTKENPHEQP